MTSGEDVKYALCIKCIRRYVFAALAAFPSPIVYDIHCLLPAPRQSVGGDACPRTVVESIVVAGKATTCIKTMIEYT